MFLFVEVHGQSNLYPPTIDTEKSLLLEKQVPFMENGLRFFRDLSFDASYYDDEDPGRVQFKWNNFLQ